MASSAASKSLVASCLKRNSEDVGWEYGVLVNPNNLDKVKCKLCNKVVSGGIYRIKQHIAHIKGNVARCPRSTKEDQAKCKKSIDDAQKAKKARKDREEDVRAEVSIDTNIINVEEEQGLDEIGGSGCRNIGPMDRYSMPIDPNVTLSGKELRQKNINDALWKERTHKVKQYIARWIYESGVPFNFINNDAFSQMLEAVGRYGPGMTRPSQHEVRECLLQEEVERTKVMLKDHEEERLKTGCTIMIDVWTDIRNLCAHCSLGVCFFESKEVSDVRHTAQHLIMSLKKHIPMTDQEGLNKLRKLAEGFEQRFYTVTTSQLGCFWNIALLLRLDIHLATLVLYVEIWIPNQNPHHPAPGVPPQGNNPAQSSAVPLMSQQKIRQGNTSAYVQAPSLPSPGQRLTNIGQTSALQKMSGKSTIPQIQLMAMQSATQSVLQQNPLNTAQESELLLIQLFQQSPERVLGQQRHLQLSMHQQPSLQQTQPTQQPNSPLQQQLIGQQPNLHKNQIKCQQGAAELQQQQRLTVQSNHHTLAFEAGNQRLSSFSSSRGAHLGILENNADEEGKAPMLESPGDETIEQAYWDGIFCPPASDNEAANLQSSSSFSDDLILSAPWEDPDYVPMADGATNLKKRKFDRSSSWAHMPIFSAPVDDHCSAPVPSFPEIPEGGQYTILGEPAAVPRMGGIDG